MQIIGILPDVIYKHWFNNVHVGDARYFLAVRLEYIKKLEEACKGKDIIPIILTNLDSLHDKYLSMIDKLMILGGDDIPAELYGEASVDVKKTNPLRYNKEFEFVKKFLKTKKPIFGICAGMQMINVALGGKLIQHIDKHNIMQNTTINDNMHHVKLIQGTRLHSILKKDKINVNSGHHQAVDINNLGDGVKISSFSEDGIPESLEVENHSFCIGVQWHPEYLDGEETKLIFESFVGG
jgi:putative glutamine amidotransferase